MDRRTLGRTGIEVCAVGMGGIPLTQLTLEEGAELVSYAIDKGIDFIETARGYQDSENKIGIGIRGRRDSVTLASKAGHKDYDGMAAAIDQSMEALDTDYIDIYQLHYVKDEEALKQALGPNGAMKALRKAQDEGKIGHVGATAHEAKPLIACMETGEFTNVQLPFNIVEREACEQLIPLANQLNIAVIVMKPLGGGIFPNARDSLRYILQQRVSVLAIGMKRKFEVDENMALASGWAPLNDEEMASLMRQAEEIGTTFCRRCYYCLPCPQGVDLSMLMIAEMMHSRHGIDELMMTMKWDEHLATAEKCARCEQCVEKCPYSLPIPDLVAYAFEKYMPLAEQWKAQHPG